MKNTNNLIAKSYRRAIKPLFLLIMMGFTQQNNSTFLNSLMINNKIKSAITIHESITCFLNELIKALNNVNQINQINQKLKKEINKVQNCIKSICNIEAAKEIRNKLTNIKETYNRFDESIKFCDNNNNNNNNKKNKNNNKNNSKMISTQIYEIVDEFLSTMLNCNINNLERLYVIKLEEALEITETHKILINDKLNKNADQLLRFTKYYNKKHDYIEQIKEKLKCLFKLAEKLSCQIGFDIMDDKNAFVKYTLNQNMLDKFNQVAPDADAQNFNYHDRFINIIKTETNKKTPSDK